MLPKERLATYLALVVAALAITVVIVIRFRLVGVPLERDEGEYAYAGQLILQGIPPYKLAYNMKFPGTYAAYAIIMAIFGQNAAGIHFGLLLTNLLTVLLVFILARRLTDFLGAAAAAASYACLSLSPSVLGLATHASHFVVLATLAGLVFLLRPRNRVSLIFGSGLLFGIAVLMKQPALMFAAFGAGYLLFSDVCAGRDLKQTCLRNLVFWCGITIPLALTCIVLLAAGVFKNFWFWTVKYAAEYATLVPLSEAGRILLPSVIAAIGSGWAIWVFAGVGLVTCLREKSQRNGMPFLLAWLLSAMLAVSSGFYFRPHYFILLLPCIALLAGIAVSALSHRLRRVASPWHLTPLLLFASALIIMLVGERQILFYLSPARVSTLLYWGNAFPECAKVADYIRAHSDPGETIAVLGSEPEIYFYSHRHSATGYIYMYGLMEPQKYAHQMQTAMIRELETARPRYLVSVSANQSWLRRPGSDPLIFAWANRYLGANYDAVALVKMIEPDRVQYYFERLPQLVPNQGDYIIIYRRKS
jgi:4-amino-4-deoxy-L-arabinose transferase-like glycosyltransferase